MLVNAYDTSCLLVTSAECRIYEGPRAEGRAKRWDRAEYLDKRLSIRISKRLPKLVEVAKPLPILVDV